jgi:hypothetical protein
LIEVWHEIAGVEAAVLVGHPDELMRVKSLHKGPHHIVYESLDVFSLILGIPSSVVRITSVHEHKLRRGHSDSTDVDVMKPRRASHGADIG